MAESLDGKHAASDEYQRSVQGSRMSDSLSMACDYYHDPFCEICAKTKEQNIKHEAFCKDCVQFLCEDCLRVHRNIQAARGHVISRGDDMPKSMADKPPKFDYCSVHPGGRKDQFCGIHKVLLCSQCVSFEHIDCPVESVIDACKGIPTSEIDALYDNVNDFKANLSSVVAEMDLNITELGKQKVDMLKDAQDMKDKSSAKIEKMSQEIKLEAESTYKTRTSNLGRGINKFNDVIASLEGTLNDIDKMKGSTVDTKVFLQIQDVLKDFEQCKSDAEMLKPLVMNVKMSFIPNKRMKEFLSTFFKMGSVSLATSQPRVAISAPEISFPLIKAQNIATCYIKLDEGERDYYFTAIEITSDGKRLLAVCDNGKIKLFSRDMTALCSLSLSTPPWDIAVTGDTEAVVSLNDAKLLILDISDSKMSIKGTVKLPFKATAIAPYKDKLLVTSWPSHTWSHIRGSYGSPASVRLIDQSGRINWSTDTDQQGQQLFSWPRYVTCHNGDTAAVIVSDHGNNTLTVLNAGKGDVISRRQVKGKGPRGVTTDTAGNIYVCYQSTGEVAILSKDMSQERFLPSPRGKLSTSPQAIVYNAVDHQLLISNISSDSKNTVDCFKL